MQSSLLAKRVWILLFVAIAIFYVWGLGALPLLGPDEPRYAEVAREMLARRDLVTPTLGGMPWFEKPPLLYWLMMASYNLFGVGEYAARFGSAICGLISAFFVYWAGRSLESASAVESGTAVDVEQDQDGLSHWGALVFLSCLGVVAFSRAASLDIVMTMTLAGALTCFLIWDIRSSQTANPNTGKLQSKLRWLLFGFYVFVGLSLLAKGLVGIIIPIGVITLYLLMRQEWPRRSFVKSLLWGTPITLAIAGLWYGPMITRHGWLFIDQFIIQHHFARFVSNKYHHPGPIYFYLPVLALLALPWTIVLLAAFASARRWGRRGNRPIDRLRLFALAWIVVPVAFFSLSSSKLTAYILPVMPAVALLVGERLIYFVQTGRGKSVIKLTGTMLIALAAIGLWYSKGDSALRSVPIIIILVSLALVGVASFLLSNRRTVLLVLIALVTLNASALAIKFVTPAKVQRESVRDLLAIASARGYSTTPVVLLHTVERTAEFYASGRLRYGSDGEPIWFQGVMQVAAAARERGGVVLCFVPVEYQSQMTSYAQTQVEVIGNNGRVALVVVRVR